jgi:hypothetical protein
LSLSVYQFAKKEKGRENPRGETELRMLYAPLEEVLEIFETLIADPAILVARRVAKMQHLRQVLFHELCPAKLAMIVIMIRFRVLSDPSSPP